MGKNCRAIPGQQRQVLYYFYKLIPQHGSLALAHSSPPLAVTSVSVRVQGGHPVCREASRGPIHYSYCSRTGDHTQHSHRDLRVCSTATAAGGCGPRRLDMPSPNKRGTVRRINTAWRRPENCGSTELLRGSRTRLGFERSISCMGWVDEGSAVVGLALGP
jgi:hypothetical protein